MQVEKETKQLHAQTQTSLSHNLTQLLSSDITVSLHIGLLEGPPELCMAISRIYFSQHIEELSNIYLSIDTL